MNGFTMDRFAGSHLRMRTAVRSVQVRKRCASALARPTNGFTNWALCRLAPQKGPWCALSKSGNVVRQCSPVRRMGLQTGRRAGSHLGMRTGVRSVQVRKRCASALAVRRMFTNWAPCGFAPRDEDSLPEHETHDVSDGRQTNHGPHPEVRARTAGQLQIVRLRASLEGRTQLARRHPR